MSMPQEARLQEICTWAQAAKDRVTKWCDEADEAGSEAFAGVLWLLREALSDVVAYDGEEDRGEE